MRSERGAGYASELFRQNNCRKGLTLRTRYDISYVERSGMHIRELRARTGEAERQIRYLIAEGFIPPPRGGRANADYGEDHVAAISRYARLRDLGFPPAAIKLLLQAGEGTPFPVAPGVTLVIDSKLL